VIFAVFRAHGGQDRRGEPLALTRIRVDTLSFTRGAVTSPVVLVAAIRDGFATPFDDVHDGKDECDRARRRGLVLVGDKGGPYRDQLYDSRPRRTIQVASALSEAELLA
jgi:hypothetical protein